MANEIKLEVYTIRIRKSRETDSFLTLDNFLDRNDFLSFFQKYISSFDHRLEVNDVQKRSLKLDSSKLVVSTQSRMISGIIESGDYGYESTIYNINSGDRQYKREVDDTEIKPFYFLLLFHMYILMSSRLSYPALPLPPYTPPNMVGGVA